MITAYPLLRKIAHLTWHVFDDSEETDSEIIVEISDDWRGLMDAFNEAGGDIHEWLNGLDDALAALDGET